MYNNNQYPQGGYQDPNQQQQGQDGEYWPNVTGFKIGPNKKGTGHIIQLTFNAIKKKEDKMNLQEFMDAIQQAFHQSGGNGVRIVLPFRQGDGPRGPFQSATIGIFPNTPQSHFNGGGGGGRRSYPPRQPQGYGQPRQQQAAPRSAPYPQQQQQQGYYPPTQGIAPQQHQVPPYNPPVQQGMYNPGAAYQQGPPPGGQTGNGTTAPPSASPSEPEFNEDNVPF